jgi:hypothetical protein
MDGLVSMVKKLLNKNDKKHYFRRRFIPAVGVIGQTGTGYNTQGCIKASI